VGVRALEERPFEPVDRCPSCGGSVMVESEDPLEEHCLDVTHCDYYRAEKASGGVILER